MFYAWFINHKIGINNFGNSFGHRIRLLNVASASVEYQWRILIIYYNKQTNKPLHYIAYNQTHTHTIGNNRMCQILILIKLTNLQ